MQRATGKAPPELDVPPLPNAAQNAWQVFCELHAERGSGFSAPNPITSASLLCWQQLHGTPLTPWEQTAIRGLDRVFFDHVATHANKQNKPPPPAA